MSWDFRQFRHIMYSKEASHLPHLVSPKYAFLTVFGDHPNLQNMILYKICTGLTGTASEY